jgi:hypothetical protein
MKRPGSGPEVFETDQIGSPYSFRQAVDTGGNVYVAPGVTRKGRTSFGRVGESHKGVGLVHFSG